MINVPVSNILPDVVLSKFFISFIIKGLKINPLTKLCKYAYNSEVVIKGHIYSQIYA